MKRTRRLQVRPQLIAAAILGAMFAACGGGGGEPPPLGDIALSAANLDDVSHAVVGGALGLGGADKLTAVAGGVAAQRRMIQAMRANNVHTTGLIDLGNTQCGVSGNFHTIVDDRDGDGAPSVGDVMTMVYTDCVDVANVTTNGTFAATFTSLDTTSMSAQVTLTSMHTRDEQLGQVHEVTLTGTMQLDFAQQSSTASTTRLTANGEVTALLATPVFSDTVTLLPGFVQDYSDDSAAGRSAVTLSGRVRSVNAGGYVTVSTDSPVVAYSADPFPSSGAVRVRGKTGTLRITALSNTQVQRDLDADGDGAFEATDTQPWEWLV